MSKTLVTGGAGFIGSHLVENLIEDGMEVVVVDNFNDYYDPNFKEENVQSFQDRNLVSVYKIDVCNKEELEEIFQNHNIQKVAHLAARAGVRSSIENPQLYYRTNVEGTLNLLELSKEHQVENFVFASSSSVYGNRESGPFSESDPTKEPTSPYAATKQACERLLYTYHHLYGLNCSALRFFTVYGERGRPDMAPYIFTKAILEEEAIRKFGDGTSKRDYTYVGDIVKGIIKALNKNLECEIINLGSNDPTTLNDFIGLLQEVTGEKAEIIQESEKPGDVKITHADNTKAKEILGWEPQVSLKEGLEKFLAWYKNKRLS